MAALFETLAPILQSRFPNRGMRLEQGTPGRLVFPAIHPAVGDISIQADGGEITVYFGHFTHCHYGPFTHPDTSQNAAEALGHLVDILDRLFSDRLVMWGSHSGRGGFFRREDTPHMPGAMKAAQFVWSGPIANVRDV